MAKKFRCTVCGYIHEGDSAPEQCPLCKVGKDKFVEIEENEGDLEFVTVHNLGDGKGASEELWKGLNDHFMGECTEVGMYLAMSRQADREGYPEVGRGFQALRHRGGRARFEVRGVDRRGRLGYQDQSLQAHERRERSLRGQDAFGSSGQRAEPRCRSRHGS